MNMPNHKAFRIALTGDFYSADGTPRYADLGLNVLEQCVAVEYQAFAEHHPELLPSQIGAANSVIVLTPRVTAQSVSEANDLLAIGRFGVGYDTVDVAACTAADVVVFITVGAVDRSVAEATVGWMLALTHHVRSKDRLVREGGWDERSQWMGSELRDRTFGTIGLGGIARATIGLLSVFGMNRPLVYDPYIDPSLGNKLDGKIVDLDPLLAESDFVSIHCPLTEETRGLIGAEQLARMKPTAYLLNTARGGIVDEDALFDVLKRRRIAGAAIDCFVDEPTTESNRFAELDNVLLAPHSIAWTNELFRDIGCAVCQGMVDLAEGRQPHGVVNPEVFERKTFQEKCGLGACL